MQTERHVANGKQYDLEIECNGFGGKVIPTYEGKSLGVTYSVSIEVAHDFGTYRGTSALDELVKVAKGDLDAGTVG